MVKLEKVIGLTTLSNASIATTISGSDTFYAAGSCVVRYNACEGGQKSFYKASNAVACLAISLDGRYLAVGERGQAPNIIIWNITSGEQHNIASNHKHGIGCITFSADGRYLVSVGFRHDRQLIVWELKSRQGVNIQKVGRKVNSIAMSFDGSFFVTCGKQHLKWWYLDQRKDVDGSLEVIGKPASIFTKYDDAIFMDVKIAADNSVYSISSCGLLCVFDVKRMMKTFVQVDSLVTYCLVLLEYAQCPSHLEKKENLILVGCSEGLIRIFSAESLEFRGNLPLPFTPVTGGGNVANKFAACLALSTIPANSQQKITGPFIVAFPLKLISIHADRSMVTWDISNIDEVSQHSFFVHHNACIWDLCFVPTSPLYPSGTFATCSADGSLRIWQDNSLNQNSSSLISIAKTEILPNANTVMTTLIQVIGDSKSKTNECAMIRAAQGIKSTDSDTSGESHPYADTSTASTVSTSLTRTIADVAIGLTRSLTDPYTGIYDLELPDRPQIPHAPRAFAVHPSGLELACGDKSGLLKIYSLSSLILTHCTQAHSSEILTIHYSPFLYPNGKGVWTTDSMGLSESITIVLLATAGRDRLIHVFNACDDYKLVITLDKHTSPVTAVKFTPDGTRLLSCGSDHNIIFYDVNGITITHVKSVMTPYSTINGLAVEATNKFGITTGQNCRLGIWNLHNGRLIRTYKSNAVKGEMYKSDIDPSGSFIATCAFDKTLSLFDFFSGELVSQVTGHSELMTSVRFSPDGSYILTAGGDGCIMKWALPYYITSAIQERILELELKEKSTIVPNPQEENKICEKAALPEPPLTIKNEKNILSIPQPCQYSQKLSQSLPHTQSRSKDFIDSHTDSRIGQFHTCVIEEADFENFHNNLHISSEDSDGAAENWLEDILIADTAIASNDQRTADNLSASLSSKFFSTLKVSKNDIDNLTENKIKIPPMVRSQNLNNEIGNSETIPLDGNIAKTKVVKNIEIADDLTKIVTVKNKIISDPEKCSVIEIKEVSKILCAVSDCADDGNDMALVDGLTRPNVIEDTLLSSPKSKAYNNHVRCPPVSTGGTYSSDENTNTDTDELLHFESDVTLCSNFHIPHNIDQSNSKLKLNIDKNSLHKENTQHSREFLLLKEDFKSKTIQCKEAYRELISAKEKAFLLFSELANLKMVFDRTIISSKNMEHSSLVVEEQVSGNIPGTLLHPRSMSSSSPNGQQTDTCSIEETKNDLFISEANEILKDFKINMPGFLLDL